VLLLGLHRAKWRVPTHQLNRYSRAYIKIHGRFRPKLFPVFCFIPTDFPFSLFSSITNQIRRWRHSSYNPLQWSPHTQSHTHKTREWKEKSINVRKCSADHHESRKIKQKKQTCVMLPVGSRKCCTYVLHILFLGTLDRNTWRKTHTFHQVPTRPAALSFTPCFLSLFLTRFLITHEICFITLYPTESTAAALDVFAPISV
jgi:hypothetical protein